VLFSQLNEDGNHNTSIKSESKYDLAKSDVVTIFKDYGLIQINFTGGNRSL